MVWTVDYREITHVVELKLTGTFSGAELHDAAVARIDCGQTHGAKKYLIDAAELHTPKSAILDVLELPTKIYADKLMDRTSRIAVVRPKDPESHWVTDFYENASVMRGWTVRIFDSVESARAWLE